MLRFGDGLPACHQCEVASRRSHGGPPSPVVNTKPSQKVLGGCWRSWRCLGCFAPDVVVELPYRGNIGLLVDAIFKPGDGAGSDQGRYVWGLSGHSHCIHLLMGARSESGIHGVQFSSIPFIEISGPVWSATLEFLTFQARHA